MWSIDGRQVALHLTPDESDWLQQQLIDAGSRKIETPVAWTEDAIYQQMRNEVRLSGWTFANATRSQAWFGRNSMWTGVEVPETVAQFCRQAGEQMNAYR